MEICARRVPTETVLLCFLAVADLVVTVALVQAGLAVEGNPVMAFYLERGLGWFVGFKLALSVGVLAVLEVIRPLCRPRLLSIGVRACLAAYVALYAATALAQWI